MNIFSVTDTFNINIIEVIVFSFAKEFTAKISLLLIFIPRNIISLFVEYVFETRALNYTSL